MSAESHRRYLEQNALREAKKAKGKGGGSGIDKEALAKLRIQTVEPWKRVALAFVAFVLFAGCAGASGAGIVWLSVVLFILAAAVAFVACYGRKKTVDSVFEGVDLLYLFDAFLD